MKKLLTLFIAISFLPIIAVAQQKDNRVVVKANIPSLYYGSNGVEIYGYWNIGFGYHFNNRSSLFVDTNFGNRQFIRINSVCNKKEISFKPSLRIYLDTRKKVFVGLGTGFTLGYADEHFTDPTEGNYRDQQYWRHTLNSFLGYDIYFLPKDRSFNIGMELSIQKNYLIWGNYDAWTGALDVRGPMFIMALLVSF